LTTPFLLIGSIDRKLPGRPGPNVCLAAIITS
jgi:hypothetical protein